MNSEFHKHITKTHRLPIPAGPRNHVTLIVRQHDRALLQYTLTQHVRVLH
jgi:hypothetical protein